MNFKQWINSLSLSHMIALANQCGLSWNCSRKQLAPLLVKSEEAKGLFRDFGMNNITTGKVDYEI